MEQELQDEAMGKIKVKSKTKSKTKDKTLKNKTIKEKTIKEKTIKDKPTNSKAKTLCQHCQKSFVFIDKHEKKCEKNPILLNQ